MCIYIYIYGVRGGFLRRPSKGLYIRFGVAGFRMVFYRIRI